MDAPKQVIVIGAGVGGLGAALALGRAGHHVTILERDPLPATPDAEAAFAAERRGAPQVHQTHGFLARIKVLLRDRFPDVYQQLLAAGGTTMSTTANLGEPQPGDEDLAVLIIRRTTLEWVLRQAVLAEPRVESRTGVSVTGLLTEDRTVTGVRLDDATAVSAGTAVNADIVVDAGGRRSALPAWLRDGGVEIGETVRESGLMYLTRWYRFADGMPSPDDPKLGGDLGFVKYLGVPGDGQTLSVTLAVRPDDGDLRRALSDDDRFDLACRILPGPDRFFRDGPLEPLSGVKPMGGLMNRLRRFVDGAGKPLVLGVHAVGDAHTCTNPLYGRGCSLALAQAVLLTDALAAHPDDAAARAASYEAACQREIEPWFHVSVEMDKAGADPAGFAAGAGALPDGAKAMAAVFVAAATDPVIGRAMVRFWNLLSTPAEFMGDPVLMARIAEVMAHPDDYPPPPREGPTREELLAALSSEDAVHA